MHKEKVSKEQLLKQDMKSKLLSPDVIADFGVIQSQNHVTWIKHLLFIN